MITVNINMNIVGFIFSLLFFGLIFEAIEHILPINFFILTILLVSSATLYASSFN